MTCSVNVALDRGESNLRFLCQYGFPLIFFTEILLGQLWWEDFILYKTRALCLFLNLLVHYLGIDKISINDKLKFQIMTLSRERGVCWYNVFAVLNELRNIPSFHPWVSNYEHLQLTIGPVWSLKLSMCTHKGNWINLDWNKKITKTCCYKQHKDFSSWKPLLWFTGIRKWDNTACLTMLASWDLQPTSSN